MHTISYSTYLLRCYYLYEFCRLCIAGHLHAGTLFMTSVLPFYLRLRVTVSSYLYSSLSRNIDLLHVLTSCYSFVLSTSSLNFILFRYESVCSGPILISLVLSWNYLDAHLLSFASYSTRVGCDILFFPFRLLIFFCIAGSKRADIFSE